MTIHVSPSAFTHPDKPRIQYWDLPGAGTPPFPMDSSYFQLIKVDEQNLFMILFFTTYEEANLWLARNFLKNWETNP